MVQGRAADDQVERALVKIQLLGVELHQRGSIREPPSFQNGLEHGEQFDAQVGRDDVGSREDFQERQNRVAARPRADVEYQERIAKAVEAHLLERETEELLEAGGVLVRLGVVLRTLSKSGMDVLVDGRRVEGFREPDAREMSGAGGRPQVLQRFGKDALEVQRAVSGWIRSVENPSVPGAPGTPRADDPTRRLPPRGLRADLDDRIDRVVRQLLSAVQEAQLDQKRGADDPASQLLDQLAARGHRSAGCQQVVHEEHAHFGSDGVFVYLQGVAPVLQLVLRPTGLVR